VRAALRADFDRLDLPRARATALACLDSDLREAPARPSFFSARSVARDRLAELFLEGVDFRERPLGPSFLADAVPFGAGGNFTPAFLALERPIAIACFAFFAPCFPSRT